MANCKLFLGTVQPSPAQTREAARQAALAHVDKLLSWSGSLRTHRDDIIRALAYRAYSACVVWSINLSTPDRWVGAIAAAARVANAQCRFLEHAVATFAVLSAPVPA